MTKELGYGLVGAGAFGAFCISQYARSRKLNLLAVADSNMTAAESIAETYNLDAYANPEDMFARSDIDLVHIATPPATHRDLVLQALRAGKHVLCEKPLATQVSDAEAMVAAARAADRVLVVNHIMRYNQLNCAVAELLDGQFLGKPIAAMVTNLAGDSSLPPEHWFWDQQKSGGIFVEHAVHFFDLLSMFLGPATILSAVKSDRPGTGFVEQVQSSALHEYGVLQVQYHGFHQAEAMDRQEVRIVCERGEVRMYGWLTTEVVVDALVDQETASRIAEIFPISPSIEISRSSIDSDLYVGRHKVFQSDARYRMTANLGADKQHLYGVAAFDLLEDQVAFINNPRHDRRVDERHGLLSLALADSARWLASKS